MKTSSCNNDEVHMRPLTTGAPRGIIFISLMMPLIGESSHFKLLFSTVVKGLI